MVADSVVLLHGCGRDGARVYRRALARCRGIDAGVFLGLHQIRTSRRHCALKSMDRRCDANVAPHGLFVVLPGLSTYSNEWQDFQQLLVHEWVKCRFHQSGTVCH